jgi:nascent polypeptide-associated complex subunit alpha
MLPGINPRQMRQAMQRMGIQQQDIEASEVIIRTKDKEYYFRTPQVARINMMGQYTYQIIGEPEERSPKKSVEINEDDIKTVMEQAKVSRSEAKTAIEEAKGDLAEAIMNLQNK